MNMERVCLVHPGRMVTLVIAFALFLVPGMVGLAIAIMRAVF